MMPGAPLLFVSYARDDRAAMEAVVPILTNLGFRCWTDRQLRAGHHIDQTIADAMRAADAVVALWSPAYVREGGYTENEWSYAKHTLRKPTTPILLEPVLTTNLGLAMGRLLVSGKPLSQTLDLAEATYEIASALAREGISPPNGMPPTPAMEHEAASRIIDPPYSRLIAMPPEEVNALVERHQRILAGNPGAAYHCMNAALVWLHKGNAPLAGDLAQRALSARPDSGEISYFAALVATASAPLSRGPNEKIRAIWSLADRAAKLEYDCCLPYLLQAAIAHEYHERNGMKPPITAEAALRQAYAKSRNAGEVQRLFAVLRDVAPSFFDRFR